MKSTAWAVIVVALLAAGCATPEGTADGAYYMRDGTRVAMPEWMMQKGCVERRMDIIARVVPVSEADAGRFRTSELVAAGAQDTPEHFLTVELTLLRTEFTDWKARRCSRRTVSSPRITVALGQPAYIAIRTDYYPRRVRVVEMTPDRLTVGSDVISILLLQVNVAESDPETGAGTLTINAVRQEEGYADLYVPSTQVPFKLGETLVITQTEGPRPAMLSEPQRDVAAEEYWGDPEHVPNYVQVTRRLPHEVTPVTLIEPMELGVFPFRSEGRAED